MVVKTKFDAPLEEDVVLEKTENTQNITDLLKNAENIFKGFLYLKDMYSSAPTFNKIVKIEYLDGVSDKEIELDSDANFIVFKNGKKDNAEIYYNKNEKLVIYPYEQFDIPLFKDDKIKVSGTLNVIQIKYENR